MVSQGLNSAVSTYQQLDTEGNVAQANSHGLISMLFGSLQLKLKVLRGYISEGQVNNKIITITKCLNILDGLRSSLNKESGGDIAQNLDELYDYMQRRLVEINISNEISIVKEIESLVSEISEAWEMIPAEARV